MSDSDDIEKHIKIALPVLIFSKHNQKKRSYTMKSQLNHGEIDLSADSQY